MYLHKHKLSIGFAAVILLTGCAPQMQKPIPLYPGKESAVEAISILQSRSKNTTPIKASGRCRLLYYVEQEQHKENFPVKIWTNPPAEIYLQGDVAFNPKGLVLGSNKDEFWLAAKPKEINSYWWGRWSDENRVQKLMISPKTLLESLGVAQIESEENWSLSNEDAFDILTKRNEQGIIVKKVYLLNSRDYPARKIEYFDNDGSAAIIIELDKYKKILNDTLVPTVIKITNCSDGEKEDLTQITLSSIKPADLTDKQRRQLFTRPQPQGFEHIYKIIDGDIIEQPQ